MADPKYFKVFYTPHKFVCKKKKNDRHMSKMFLYLRYIVLDVPSRFNDSKNNKINVFIMLLKTKILIKLC